MADILIVEQGDGGEMLFVGGDVATDSGLFTGVYVSLFTGNAFFGALLPKNQRYNGDFIESLHLPITSESLRVIGSKTEENLQWLLDDGVASSVTASVISPENKRIEIEITIIEPDGAQNKFVFVWDTEREGIARAFDVSNGGYGLGE